MAALNLSSLGGRKKRQKINLLPQEEFAASTMGRILAWALSTFRVIVIITEVIIMGAFLSRFWLDARNADLSDEIQQRQAVIVASKEFEDEFNSVQKKLSIISALSKEVPPAQVLGNTTPALPQDIFIDTYSHVNKEVRIKGISPSERSIAQFMTNLSALENTKKATLTQLDTQEGQESLLIFGVTVELKE